MSLAKRKRAARLAAQAAIQPEVASVDPIQEIVVELETQEPPVAAPEPPGATETVIEDSALPLKKQVVKKKSYKQKQE